MTRLAAFTLLLVACASGARDASTVNPGPSGPGSPGGPEGPTADLGMPGPPGPQPSFGATVSQLDPPPPISGGTLLVTLDGKTAVAADPDRDQIYVVDLAQQMLVATVALQAGDEPGRAAEDAAGRVHVALRRGGALVTLDPTTWKSTRRTVCPAPRGVAYQATGDLVHVACAGGELVSLPAAGGAATRTVQVDSDLRDVIVDGASLRVSRFRAAELLTLDASGAVTARSTPSQGQGLGGTLSPAIAWRTIASSLGTAFMVHQLALDAAVNPVPGGYGGSDQCGGVVQSTVTSFPSAGAPTTGPSLALAVLPVDVALSPDGMELAVIAAGNAFLSVPGLQVVPAAPQLSQNGCGSGQPVMTAGEPIAVAFAGAERLIVQSREPAQLEIFDALISTATVPLSTVSRADTGHAIFHADAGGFVACASCHAEGGEDGRVWQFIGIGPRRTQTLRGRLSGTEPFHWNGDMADLSALAHAVFEGRMSGPMLADDQLAALRHFLDGIPLVPAAAPADPQAVTRGAALFASAGCSGCHSGAQYTNNTTVDVGTGAAFQVPRLVGLWAHPPYLHDGCAATLADRFGSCGGTQHGNTAGLTGAQVSDLLAFLLTL